MRPEMTAAPVESGPKSSSERSALARARLLRGLLPAMSLVLVLLAIAWLNPRAISYFGFSLMLNLAVPIALATPRGCSGRSPAPNGHRS
ncbi:MAG: hypothetical protein EOS19_30660, partial [Mesorhizobium sp.]